jgi:hypothetical protein
VRVPWRRAVLVWLVMAVVEIVHGALRAAILVPIVGDWRARQIGAIVGAALVLVIAILASRWLGVRSRRAQLSVGALWLALMLSFELAAGRFLAGYSWARIASDYDLRHGGLLGIGMLVLALSPLLAARLRHVGDTR